MYVLFRINAHVRDPLYMRAVNYIDVSIRIRIMLFIYVWVKRSSIGDKPRANGPMVT